MILGYQDKCPVKLNLHLFLTILQDVFTRQQRYFVSFAITIVVEYIIWTIIIL